MSTTSIGVNFSYCIFNSVFINHNLFEITFGKIFFANITLLNVFSNTSHLFEAYNSSLYITSLKYFNCSNGFLLIQNTNTYILNSSFNNSEITLFNSNPLIILLTNIYYNKIHINNSHFIGFLIVNNGSILNIISVSASISINNCTFMKNQALAYGGVFYIFYSGNISINYCKFYENIAFSGGSLYYDDSDSNNDLSIKLNSNDFEYNNAKIGGSLMFYDKLPNNFSLTNSNSFKNNFALSYGEDFASSSYRLLFLGKDLPLMKKYDIDSLRNNAFYSLKTSSGSMLDTTLRFVFVDKFYQAVNIDFLQYL